MTDLRNAIMARLWGLDFFEVGHATDTMFSAIEDEGYVIVKRRWWHRYV